MRRLLTLGVLGLSLSLAACSSDSLVGPADSTPTRAALKAGALQMDEIVDGEGRVIRSYEAGCESTDATDGEGRVIRSYGAEQTDGEGRVIRSYGAGEEGTRTCRVIRSY